jgi:hypothetical protein
MIENFTWHRLKVILLLQGVIFHDTRHHDLGDRGTPHFHGNYLDSLIGLFYYERRIVVVMGRKVLWLIFV